MINFNLEKSKIFLALKLETFFLIFGILKNIFLVISIFFLFYSVPFFVFFFFLTYWCWYLETFFNFQFKNPPLKSKIKDALERVENYNLANFLDFECAKIFFFALNFAKKNKISSINSSLLFYSLLEISQKLNFVFSRLLLSKKEIKDIFLNQINFLTKGEEKIFAKDFENAIIGALKLAVEKGKEKISPIELLVSLAKENEIFKKILIEADLKMEDIENACWFLEYLEKEIVFEKKFWEKDNLAKIKSLGKEFSAGYTVNLDRFSFDTEYLIKREGLKEFFGHEKEVEALERILSGYEKNDALIVGEPGSGRKSIIENLAQKMVLGKSTSVLNYKKIVWLDVPKLIASTITIEEAEALLDTIFTEVERAGNVILVIDDFHNFIGVERELLRKAGALEISGSLSHYLPSPQFQFIGITTFEGLHLNLEQKPEMLNLLEKIEVAEISPKDTLLILGTRALRKEKNYKVFVSFQALRKIIELTEKYQPSLPFPEKATELLDEAILFVSQKKENVILPKHIAFVLSQKTQIPIGEVETKEKEILLNLEELIHQRLINQEEAVSEVANALRRARAEIKLRKGPMGSFLFLGPTGVGKTETAKALAEIYFGGEEKMIRLDMSEFQKVDDISRLIGAPGQEGLLTTPVRENPFSLILLDEFEKAHLNIFNLFLQVLDEGHITDGQGRKVDFKNTIIIATSNAGYQMIFKATKEGKNLSQIKDDLINFFVEKGIFRPELLNRFDAVVLYKPLSQEDLLKIAELQFKKIQKQLKEKEIEFVFSEKLKEKIVDLSYTPEFGARAMQRVIQEKIGNCLAKAILEGKIRRGNKIEIEPENFEVKILF